jgi:hypothetical protein
MRRRKPLGWPSYLADKRLSGGRVGYYWQPPTWARKLGCPIKAEALGSDYAEAKRRYDEILNVQFHTWLRHDEIGDVLPLPGSFLWLVATFKASPKYLKLSSGTRADYDAVLSLVAAHKLTDGRSFGELALRRITPGAADRLHARLLEGGRGNRQRPRSWPWTFVGVPGEWPTETSRQWCHSRTPSPRWSCLMGPR